MRDWIPPQIIAPLGLPPLKEALTYMHRPPREVSLAEFAAGCHPAQRRLAFEELLAHHLSLKLLKRAVQSEPALRLDDARGACERFLAALPFELTGAQRRALAGSRCRSPRGPPDAAAGAR